MGNKRFTEEEIRMLEDNQYTISVSATTVRYTLAFKQFFWEKIQSGMTTREIFIEAGFDPDMLGKQRLESFRNRVKEEANSSEGLRERHVAHKANPKAKDYESMAPKVAMKHMQAELIYLRQEMEFVKKIMQAVNSVKSKK